jgi:hypothetical protein
MNSIHEGKFIWIKNQNDGLSLSVLIVCPCSNKHKPNLVDHRIKFD